MSDQIPPDEPLDPTIQQPVARSAGYRTVKEGPVYAEEVVEPRRWTTGALIAAALLGFLLGLIIGYFIGRASAPDQPATVVTSTTETTELTTTSSSTTSTTQPTTTTRPTTTTASTTTTTRPTTTTTYGPITNDTAG